MIDSIFNDMHSNCMCTQKYTNTENYNPPRQTFVLSIENVLCYNTFLEPLRHSLLRFVFGVANQGAQLVEDLLVRVVLPRSAVRGASPQVHFERVACRGSWAPGPPAFAELRG